MEPSKGVNYDELDSVNQCIIKLCLLLQKSGIEYTACIEKLNYRRKKKIESYLIGEAIELEYPEDIYNELLEAIKKLFDPEYEDNIVEDDNEWQELTNDDDLPFQ